MQIKKSIYVKRLSGFIKHSQYKIYALLNEASALSEGKGFIDISFSNEVLSSTYIFTSTVSREILDQSSSQIQLVRQQVLHKVPFDFDFETGLMFAYAGGYKLRRLIVDILDLFGNNISLINTSFSIPEFLLFLTNKGITLTKVSFLIHNFRTHSNLSGNYYATTTDLIFAQEIATKYSSDISEMKLVILSEKGDEVILHFTCTGKITIKAEEISWCNYLSLTRSFCEISNG